MQLFEINYTLGSYAGADNSGAFNTSSSSQNLRTTITAENYSQARAMIEGMYGSGVQIHSIVPK